ncbi:microtubule-associated protein futsch-like [Helicoverpa zea]|uniref:microtubule-associated protein futsch-like n=1 Tax=Helicoverpa zea TaxID=7113 RepID=UPI001F596FD1|nr:microtubule-associated protein futsch-like [Helicoverpa zea]
MIVLAIVVTIIFSIGILSGVNGASYSNVYVERDIAPRGYYRYGAPYTSLADPRISQITSLPAITEYGAPCGSPCVFPAQAISSVVAPVNPSPNVIAYSAPVPNVPVLVTPPKEATNGYEYSYAVYDESTGDHKAQRELSDGSVVRGEYSFIQPDGYVREVQYVADDISGFNAVVKNFLPATVEVKKKIEPVVKIESSPPLNFDCHEIKSESIKQGSTVNSEAITEQLLKIHENLHKELSKEVSAENSKEINTEPVTQAVSEEESKANSNEKSAEVNSKEQTQSKEGSGEETENKSKEVPETKPESTEEPSTDVSGEKSKENLQLEPKTSKEESSEKSKEENSSSKESGPKSEEKDSASKPASNESTEESVSKESKEELKEKPKKKATEEKTGENGKNKETFELLKPPQEGVVPYHDIIRCIQAAMRRSYGVPSINEEHSPLTYIVLNKPC